jgi:hypothetical protein
VALALLGHCQVHLPTFPAPIWCGILAVGAHYQHPTYLCAIVFLQKSSATRYGPTFALSELSGYR